MKLKNSQFEKYELEKLQHPQTYTTLCHKCHYYHLETVCLGKSAGVSEEGTRVSHLLNLAKGLLEIQTGTKHPGRGQYRSTEAGDSRAGPGSL